MNSEVVRWITWTTKQHQSNKQQLQQRRNNMDFRRFTSSSSSSSNSNCSSSCDNILFKSSFYKLVFLWLVINVNLILVNGNDRSLPLVSLIVNDSNIINNDNNRYGFDGHYTSTWAVHIPDGDIAAKRIADEHGFICLGKVCTFYFIWFCFCIFFHIILI